MKQRERSEHEKKPESPASAGRSGWYFLIKRTSLELRLTPDLQTFPYARFTRMTSPRIHPSRIMVMQIFAPFFLNANPYKNGLIKENCLRLPEQFYHFL
ncbi:hypothetical protein Y032_0003g1577 [Ancylostoma ceylanicum]|uniref:Uncharacterized protein n=1 Tax=Ancylostoma ceylanicum TaxID=53326 RepID=A0A016VZJ4_9BILA|nr:hypothetical protein Y032_0003g1577 [Ancylostoma ceylanicum]